jgi:RHS repeat-associated protein
VFDADSSIYNSASHYSYDIHGNVKTLWTDNPPLAAISQQLSAQRFKRIDYDYDLVSGKVNDVYYQHDSIDAFAHHYEYDADNRITQVYTSKYPDIAWTGNQDDPLWDRDAKYFYYNHGPLARTEIGNDKVQGIDYAYTLQGWIKGVNSETLDSTRDIGLDGYVITGNNDSMFAKDVFGYTLNYFHNDYKSITSTSFIADTTDLGSTLFANAPNLYNGNIRAMVTTITNPTNGDILPMLTAYKYDQLNRIKQMKAFDDIDLDSNKWENTSWTDKYKNTFDYDANGNIDTLHRYDANQNIFDNFTYNYLRDGNGKLMQNRLYHINDAATPLTSGEDITDQGTFESDGSLINRKNNYNYDEIGNLKKDSAEGIANIEWTVYGKVKSITRRDGFSKTVNGTLIYPSDLEFLYDPTGNRIAKIEKTRDTNGLKPANEWKTTYYVRDAQGNEMAVYKLKPTIINGDPATSFKLIENPMYGSSRLGSSYDTLELISPTPQQSSLFTHTLGNKQFELSNHLGNVLATVSDRKIQHSFGGTNVDYFAADIKSAQDYYPFGMLMPDRNFSSDTYRHSFNGKEKDDEWNGTTGGALDLGARIYDARIGRFLSIDPLQARYPGWSPYAAFNDNPIVFIDPSGEGGVITINHDKGTINFATTMYVYRTGDVTDVQIRQALKIEGIANTTAYTSEASTLNYYYQKGDEIITKTYTATYTVNIVIIDPSELDAKMKENAGNSAVSFYKFQQEGYGEEKAQGHTDMENGKGGQGLNTGVLSIDKITAANETHKETGQGVAEIILEEGWHSMAGANYEKDKEPGVPAEYTHNVPDRLKSICDNSIAGENLIQKKDITAVFKSLNTTFQAKAKGNETFTAGKAVNVK